MEIINIATDLIDEDKEQPRYQFAEESLQELMNSIEELGLLSPIKVRALDGGRYKIIYGNRRYKACKALGRASIPCIVSAVTNELDIYLEQIAENLTREGFSPIEEAEAFHKLMNDPKFSSSVKYLSSKLGKPESYIKNKCELLKFGNAVKKMIVGGTEIRKDALTEEQLLPIKDLPLEHRDPLAKIIARDELPVSDVKKIARLFKDKSISSGTKDKLLYKSGPELIETWSVFEQNKAERTKPSQPKAAAAKKEKPEEAQNSGLPATPPAAAATATAASIGSSEIASASPSPLESKLRSLLTALPANTPLPADWTQLPPEAQERLLGDVHTLIDTLEKQLKEWRQVKELASSAPVAAGLQE
ncbi:ParB/RepB/Spo0J family partition protein [Paenibacillus doosanensis]|uniref:ParB/RepB/Spo0J family partition protein n=1 Tax=Paenibacillus doosanensis TaxID=1229154 RepID=UPI002180485F|nr:ParB/RepB/Spo0J family partition protein [Paenibacillus doosanensis]MCS7461577.1 ParB/RepB/Spo0J family partition protein [Paenibacillus doosanensis]